MATAGKAMAQMGVAADAKKMQQQVMAFRWVTAGAGAAAACYAAEPCTWRLADWRACKRTCCQRVAQFGLPRKHGCALSLPAAERTPRWR